jgi:hypothetical protein
MSEGFEQRAEEVHRAYWFEGLEASVAKLESVLQNEELTAEERKYFQGWHLASTRALDADFRPSFPDRSTEVDPLDMRYKHCLRNRQPAEATRAVWRYVQHCAFGTYAFQEGLDTLVDFAVRSGNLKLGRYAAEILLRHYAIINLVRYDPLLPIGGGAPSETHEWPDGVIDLYVPWRAAMEALEEDDSQCWADILELKLEMASPESRTWPYYSEVLNALRQHYQRAGNVARLEWLKAYEP